MCVNTFPVLVGQKSLCVNDFFGVVGRIVDNAGRLASDSADGKGLLCNDLRRFGGRENAGGAHRVEGDPIGGGRVCGNIGRGCGNVGRGGGEVGGGRCGGGDSGGRVGKEVEHHAFEVGEARLLQWRGGGQRERTHVGAPVPAGEADERGDRPPVPTGCVPGLGDEVGPAAGYVLVPTGFAAGLPAAGTTTADAAPTPTDTGLAAGRWSRR